MTAEVTTRVIAADAGAAEIAARCLQAGGLVAFPTETVYGLGADAGNGEAIARLYAAKGRPAFNPLIAHVGDIATARKLAMFDAAAELLACAFWPGPLTLVLPKRQDCRVADLATAGLDTLALRVPAHSAARDILTSFGGPIVAPSANRSGHVSPTTAAHVLADLRGRIDLIIDGGPAPLGVESTIIACLGAPELLRPGGVPRAEIEKILRQTLATRELESLTEDDGALAPGMLASHYAPKARLRLEATDIDPGDAVLAFGSNAPKAGAQKILNLSARGDLVEAAANLFSHLRALDACGAETIAVMPVPREGLGEAINDRLQRAAAPRLPPRKR